MKIIILLLLCLIVILQYRLWIGNVSLTEVHHLELMKQNQIAENQGLLERNRSLAAEVMDLKQGHEAIEERARSELGMIKSNETFYQIISNEPIQDEALLEQ